jgi:hypothetical protein
MSLCAPREETKNTKLIPQCSPITIEKGSHVLVTGVTGFAAAHVANQLLKAGIGSLEPPEAKLKLMPYKHFPLPSTEAISSKLSSMETWKK